MSLYAKTVYVTDDGQYTLRSSDNTTSKILQILPSGSELTVLSEDKNTGYSKVRTAKEVKGYILTKYISNKPTNKWLLNKANEKIQRLQHENSDLKQNFIGLDSNSDLSENSTRTLVLERDTLNKKLLELRKTSSNAIQIKQQRDNLQERFIFVERELQKLKRENQSLENGSNQDWFLYGGLLSLLGVVLGVFLPKLSRRRRPSSSWDTF